MCPLCGKFVSVSKYDPSGFEDDILLVQVRGLGRGKGVKVVGKYSLLDGVLDGEETHVLEQIRDRVSRIHALLFEELESEEETYDEKLNRINEVLSGIYPEGFSDLWEAIDRLLEEYHDLTEKSEDRLT